MKLKGFLPRAALALAAGCCTARLCADVPVASGGSPQCAIVAPAELEKPAKELAKYLNRITGAEIPLAAKTEGNRIELKLGPLAGGSGNPATEKQGYTLSAKGNALTITAPTEWGVLYGVYGLLTDRLGCRFYSPDVEVIPGNKNLVIADFTETKEPSFPLRGYVYNPWMEKDWLYKNRGGGRPPVEGLNAGHTLYSWVKPAVYFKDHPEWFAMNREGKREQNWAMGICGTNEVLAAELAKLLIEAFEKNPNNTPSSTVIFPIAQGDGFSPCQCPECRKLVKENGSEAAPLILLFNRALEIASKKYPNLSIITFAYFQTLGMPKKMAFHKNLYVDIVSSSYSQNQAGDQFNGIENVPANRHYEQAIRDWTKALPGRVSIYHWDGVDAGNGEYSEWPNVLAHARDIKFWHRCGVASAQKAGYARPNWGWLTEYLWFRIMWDVTLDEKEVLRDYLTGVYGTKAAPVLMEYFEYLETIRKDAGYGCPTVRWTSFPRILMDKVFTESVRKTMDSYLIRAQEEANKESDPVYAERLADARATSVDELFLNANVSAPLSLTRDAAGQTYIVHGTDTTLPERIRRIRAYTSKLKHHPGSAIGPVWALQNHGGEAYLLNGGAMEAAVCPALRGQIPFLTTKDGKSVFGSNEVWSGYSDEFPGLTKAWSAKEVAKDSVSMEAVIGPAEWMNTFGEHIFRRKVQVSGNEMKIFRSYERLQKSTTDMPAKSAFSARFVLAMPDPLLAATGLRLGSRNFVVSPEKLQGAPLDAVSLKRAADRLASDCQNPLFDKQENIASDALSFDLTKEDKDILMSFSRGDGVLVEIASSGEGWKSVSFIPDPEKKVLTVMFNANPSDMIGDKQTLSFPEIVLRTREVAPAEKIAAASSAPQEKPVIRMTAPGKAVNTLDGAEMVWIPAGKFLRGSPSGVGGSDEHPQREITLDGFWMYKYPVTLGQYKKYLAAVKKEIPALHWGQNQMLDKSTPADDYPVLLSWNEASEYAKWARGSLPTEAQWEKAARGDQDARQYPWGDTWDGTKAPGWEMTLEKNLEGMFPANAFPQSDSPYGVSGMIGNNFEWVFDWYGHDYYKTSPDKNPRGPETGTNKILKGGDSNFDENFARISFRFLSPPNARDWTKNQFRCAIDAQGPELKK